MSSTLRGAWIGLLVTVGLTAPGCNDAPLFPDPVPPPPPQLQNPPPGPSSGAPAGWIGPSSTLSWDGALTPQSFCGETFEPCTYLHVKPVEDGRLTVRLFDADGGFYIALAEGLLYSGTSIAEARPFSYGGPVVFSADVKAQTEYHLAVSRWHAPVQAPFRVEVEGPRMHGSPRLEPPGGCC